MDISSYIPKYDIQESITKYFQKVEIFKLKLKEEKYNLLLNFINEWINDSNNQKFKSLTDFKNISEKKLLIDPKHNEQILKKFNNSIIKKFNINFNIEKETNNEKIKNKYIIYLLSKALSSIDYILISKSINQNTYYSIKLK